ncbi:MAG: ShlB/FhaC/HecB family hemolysin secretion/activation protein [Alphaproteobacteria bacterium]
MKKTENNWQLHAVRRAALLGAAMLTAMPLAAAAQVTIPGSALPGAVQPGRGDRPAPTPPSQPDFDFSIDAPSRSAIGRAVDTVTFTLKDLKITGAKTLPEESFRPLYAKLIGQTVKLNDILDVADGIEKVYRDKGYILVRAYVPPQRVRDGVFTINIVEGKIAHVTVQGGTPATQDQIRSYVAPAMDRAPLPLASMERSLLLSNDLPGTQATGVLKPSEDIPGASDLVVNVDQPRVTGGIGADNRGSRYSGLWTLNADAEINSIFDGADQLSGVFTTSPDASEQVAGQARYRRAIGPDGVIGTIAGTITRGQPGSTLSAFGVVTDSWAVGPRLTWPMIRTREESLQIEGGITFQEANIEVLSSRIAHDVWRVADINATYLKSNWLGGSWLATVGVAQGIPGLGSSANLSADLSRMGGYLDFTKFTGLVRYVGILPKGFSFVVTGQGQFSSAPLINGELISFGGVGIGRGYDPGAITGDHGLGGSGELRYDAPWANEYVLNVQPYVYVDGGQTWYIQRGAATDPSLLDQNIVSVGGGVRLALPYNASLGLEGSHTLHAVTGSDVGKEATKFFVTAGIRF